MRTQGSTIKRPAVSTIGWAGMTLAWSLLITLEAADLGDLLAHDDMLAAGLPSPAALGTFAVGWLAMVVAMMLPGAISPAATAAGLEATHAAHKSPNGSAFAGFMFAYLALWTGFGLVALIGDAAIHQSVSAWGWLARREHLVGAALLAAVGAFQLSPAKRRGLVALRRTLDDGPSAPMSSGWALGWGFSVARLRCCWALMLLVFAVGGSLWWMLGVTLVMVGEQRLPSGRGFATTVGVVLIAAGVAAAFRRGLLIG